MYATKDNGHNAELTKNRVRNESVRAHPAWDEEWLAVVICVLKCEGKMTLEEKTSVLADIV